MCLFPGRDESRKLDSTWTWSLDGATSKWLVCLALPRARRPQLQPKMSPLSTWQQPRGMWGHAGVWVGPGQPRASLIGQHQPQREGGASVGTRSCCFPAPEPRTSHQPDQPDPGSHSRNLTTLKTLHARHLQGPLRGFIVHMDPDYPQGSAQRGPPYELGL